MVARLTGARAVDYPNRIAFIEVVKPERLVYTHGAAEGDPGEFHVTVTFEEQGARTRLTLRSLFRTAAERAKVVREYHAIDGGNQTIDRLAEHLAKRQ